MQDVEIAGRLFRVILDTPEGPRSLQCGADEYLLDAAARHGIQLRAICRQGHCLTCAGKLLEGEVDVSDADVYFPEDKAAGYVLLCRGKPCSDVRIVTGQEWKMREHRLSLGLPAPYA